MARFLVYTSPARGHLYPIVPTLLKLVESGHELHVRTLASEIEPLQRSGLHAMPIHPAIEATPLDDWKASSPEDGLGQIFTAFARRAQFEIPDLQGAIDELEPDALMIDITTSGAAAVAEKSGLPWARWIPYFLHFDAVTGPSETLSMMPFVLAEAGMQVVNAPRKQLGLSTIKNPDELWSAPLHLYLTGHPFEDPDLSIPRSVRLVGPGAWDPPSSLPDWLSDLNGRQIVLVAASSELQADSALIDAALKALEQEDVYVVVTTAAHDPKQFSVPDNARVVRWLPHNLVLPKVNCVVCHGGMGITQKTLAHSVPVCVVPFGRDQAEVASRVAAVEAGTVLLPEQLSPVTLRDAVHIAMTKRKGAEAVAAGFARAGGPTAAAQHLTSLLP